MKKRLILLMLVLLCFLGACQAKQTKPRPAPKKVQPVLVHQFEIGKPYQISNSQTPYVFFKFINERQFTYMVESDIHISQKQLDKQNEERDGGSYIYPWIRVIEGNYVKEGENYTLTPTKIVSVGFKDVKNVKDKIVSTKRIYSKDENNFQIRFTRDGDHYYWNSQTSTFVYDTKEAIPNSIDDFLALYQYQPEDLD